MSFESSLYIMDHFTSVAQSCPTLQPHGLQHTRLPCPTSTPRACLNSCPSSWWCHPTISSSVIPFSSCLQSFPASGSFPMSQSFASGSQSTGVSALASVLPMNIQGWFLLDWFDLLAVQGALKSLLQNHSSKALILRGSAFFIVQLSHPYMTTGKTIALTRQTYPSASLKSKRLLEWPDPLHSYLDNTMGNRRVFHGHRHSHCKYKPLLLHEECLPDLPEVAEGMGGCAGHTGRSRSKFLPY